MKRVFVVGGGHAFDKFFQDFGWSVISNPFDADLFQFTGGEDVTPEIYNCLNISSHNNFMRDLEEMGWYALAKRLDKPMIGICRGAQFLNVMCGGAMIQDVAGHTRSHPIAIGGRGESIMATSTHHQMMIPGNHAKVLAWAEIVYKKGDPEVVFYEHDRCVCFQPHPEYRQYKPLEEYYFQLIDSLLINR